MALSGRKRRLKRDARKADRAQRAVAGSPKLPDPRPVRQVVASLPRSLVKAAAVRPQVHDVPVKKRSLDFKLRERPLPLVAKPGRVRASSQRSAPVALPTVARSAPALPSSARKSRSVVLAPLARAKTISLSSTLARSSAPVAPPSRKLSSGVVQASKPVSVSRSVPSVLPATVPPKSVQSALPRKAPTICKERPSSTRSKGGQSKSFVPWCS